MAVASAVGMAVVVDGGKGSGSRGRGCGGGVGGEDGGGGGGGGKGGCEGGCKGGGQGVHKSGASEEPIVNLASFILTIDTFKCTL